MRKYVLKGFSLILILSLLSQCLVFAAEPENIQFYYETSEKLQLSAETGKITTYEQEFTHDIDSSYTIEMNIMLKGKMDMVISTDDNKIIEFTQDGKISDTSGNVVGVYSAIKWYHLAYSIDKDNMLNMYVNNEKVVSKLSLDYKENSEKNKLGIIIDGGKGYTKYADIASIYIYKGDYSGKPIVKKTVAAEKGEDVIRVTPTPSQQSVMDKLKIFGIYNKSSDENFNIADIITRAEFVQMVISMLGKSELAQENVNVSSFSDIATGSEMCGYIETAYQMGIVGGYSDGTFGPNQSVAYEVAIKVLMSALGYKSFAEQNGGYPDGYISEAMKVGLLKNVTPEKDGTLNWINAIMMINNALSADYLVQTQFGENEEYTTGQYINVLSETRGIYHEKGQVTAVEATKINRIDGVGDGNAEIDEVTYKIGNSNVADYLGYTVDFYYHEDEVDVFTLLNVEPTSSSKMINVDSDLIGTSTTTEKFIYLENEDDSKWKTANISPTANVIRNGKYAGRKAFTFDNSDFIPEVGSIKLIDFNGDNIYDIVFIENYIEYYVNYYDAALETISDKYGKADFVLDADEAIVYKDGNEASVTSITRGDVLLIGVSDDGNVANIMASSNKVKGKITEIIDNEKYIINGNEYKLAKEYKEKIDTYDFSPTLRVGYYGSFAISPKGEIMAMVTEKSDEWIYGFMIDISKNKGIDGDVQAKIFNQKSEMIKPTIKDKVKIDGVTAKGNARIYAALLAGNAEFASKLIRYKLNEEGLVTDIDTPLDNPEEDSESLEYGPGFETYKWKYCERSGNLFIKTKQKTADLPGLGENANCSFYIGSLETYVFEVPTAANYKTADDKFYKVLARSDLADNGEYLIQAFNVEDYGNARVIVIQNPDSTASDTMIDTYDMYICVIDKVTKVVDDYGDIRYKVYYYQKGVYKQSITAPLDEMYIYHGFDLDENKKPIRLTMEDFTQQGTCAFMYISSADKTIAKITKVYPRMSNDISTPDNPLWVCNRGADAERTFGRAIAVKPNTHMSLYVAPTVSTSPYFYTVVVKMVTTVVDLKNGIVRKGDLNDVKPGGIDGGDYILVNCRNSAMMDVVVFKY